MLLALLVASPPLLHAQTGAIGGRVVDASGDPLPGANVTLTQTERGAATEPDGRFVIEGVPAGVHVLRVSLVGYETAEDTVDVRRGQMTQVAIRLAETTLEMESVVVESETEASRLEASAQAVDVVRLETAQVETADLGDVLAQTKGVSVRRSGGLGSDTRFSLNGLTDDQVRFFLDGIPLDLAGFPFGIANVPVGLVDRVEIYKGVVPTRFGADALGGAVNLVTPESYTGARGSASYQVGSFGTHRAALTAGYEDEKTGLFVRGSGFVDRTDNDYSVRVKVPSEDPDTRGQLMTATHDRFHDEYRATGGRVEFGVTDRSWTDRLLLRAFASTYDNELQSNRTMTRPYGEVEFGGETVGGALRYRHGVTARLSVDLTGGYTYRSTDFLDVATCIYNWAGECVRERQQRGEINPGTPRDETLFERVSYGRLNLTWEGSDRHTVRFTAAPTREARSGEDRIRTGGDVAAPITADRTLFSVVSGIEYEVNLLDGRLQNIVFGKNYVQQVRSEDPVPGGGTRRLSRDQMRFGGGNMLRYQVTDRLQAKVSYEYATRLPRAQEIFGDVVDTNANLELQPEVSHNFNLGVKGDVRTPSGRWQGEVTGFLRETDDLILALPASGNRFRNENVFAARSIGVEGSARWTSLDDLVSLEGNATYLDFRNRSETGPLAPFEGDRIPNRPYLFANGSARIQLETLLSRRDRVSLEWDTRFVDDFFQFWESAGTRESKRIIPDQLLHSLALIYRIQYGERSVSLTAQSSNLADAQAYDFYGAERPGRAVSFKATITF
jgi:outer membrane receptor protein involved in Fe transport